MHFIFVVLVVEEEEKKIQTVLEELVVLEAVVDVVPLVVVETILMIQITQDLKVRLDMDQVVVDSLVEVVVPEKQDKHMLLHEGEEVEMVFKLLLLDLRQISLALVH
tara:strand:- start:505 stop:825 length:321 start_codon:yes stop_codon:yes gene_type:complete